MRYHFLFSLVAAAFWANGQEPPLVNLNDSISQKIVPELGVRFGTIVKLEVEIYDGDSLQMKAYMGDYLLKVNSINGAKVADTLLLRFIDETESLATNDFELYKLTTGKTATRLSGEQAHKLKTGYVGRKLTVMAYETGEFTGIPDKYFEYRPNRYGLSFHFEHHLVIVSSPTK